MEIYIDIETLRSPESHRLQILEDVKVNFKAPTTLSKGQAATDLGLTDKDDIKFTSKDDMIARWEKELAGEKSADVAQALWEKTSFNPDVAPIACICIGWFIGDEYNQVQFFIEESYSEKYMLIDFHSYVDELCNGTQPHFIGHNLGKFDLPFIWKRSVINDVRCCGGVKWQDGRHGQHFFDTMIAWAGFGKTVSADNLAKLLAVGGKSDMDGSMVYDTWQENPQKVIDYCHDDVTMVKDIYKRMSY